jgi:hypothetical protein
MGTENHTFLWIIVAYFHISTHVPKELDQVGQWSKETRSSLFSNLSKPFGKVGKFR